MSNKEIVLDLLKSLPDDVSLYEISRRVDFVAGVRESMAEIDGGEGLPIEEVERELPSWVIK